MTISTVLCLIAIVAAPMTPPQSPVYQIVVNASNPVSSLSREEVSRLFLKRQPAWKAGGSVLPVDLERGSRTREAFTKAVHGRSVSAIGTFWQQQIFAGKQLPPPEKRDEDVLDHVRTNPNAIGYITAGTALGNGVKIVTISR